jgi:hypothetical protein
VAPKQPLGLVMFFADMTDALSERELLHRRLLMLRHPRGQLRVRGIDCLTESDGATGVVKLTIAGLEERPEFDDGTGEFSLSRSGLTIDLEQVSITEQGNIITVYLN